VNRGASRAPNPSHIPPTPAEELPSSSSTVKPDEEVQPVAVHQETSRTAVADDSNPTKHPFYASISPEIHEIVAELADRNESQLPEPTTKVWNAEHLTHMYISAYKSGCWNVCDLIADTWIRAFQSLNKDDPIWRTNKTGYIDKVRDLKTAGLGEQDQLLDTSVCCFDAKLLNNLYHHTDKKCGARMLWADTMALCGQDWEDQLTSKKRQHEQWHPDLNWNVMCTALRLVRRRLTLKIEENIPEGVWCKRYHMHTQHNTPCYRELAGNVAHTTGRGKKRRAQEIDDVEMGPEQKRVSFGGTVEDFDSEEE
jgi:hypothetical protein